VDPDLLKQTILPILQMKNTAFLALSSPGNSENHFSQLYNLLDDTTGEPWFRRIDAIM
jgi:hypothetical protein